MSFVSRPWMFLIPSVTRFWCETPSSSQIVDIYYRRGTLPVPEFPAIIGDEHPESSKAPIRKASNRLIKGRCPTAVGSWIAEMEQAPT